MNGLPARPPGTIVRRAEAASWIDGYAFLERARAHADALVAETEAGVAAARAEGFETGRRSGEAEAAERLARAVADIDRSLSGLDAQLAELALSIVRKVLGTFDDAALVAACAREALAAFRGENRVVLRVAPDLVAAVEASLRERGGDALPVIVEGDAELSGHRCIASSAVATVEVGLDAQLDALRTAFAPRSSAA